MTTSVLNHEKLAGMSELDSAHSLQCGCVLMVYRAVIRLKVCTIIYMQPREKCLTIGVYAWSKTRNSFAELQGVCVCKL